MLFKSLLQWTGPKTLKLTFIIFFSLNVFIDLLNIENTGMVLLTDCKGVNDAQSCPFFGLNILLDILYKRHE